MNDAMPTHESEPWSSGPEEPEDPDFGVEYDPESVARFKKPYAPRSLEVRATATPPPASDDEHEWNLHLQREGHGVPDDLGGNDLRTGAGADSLPPGLARRLREGFGAGPSGSAVAVGVGDPPPGTTKGGSKRSIRPVWSVGDGAATPVAEVRDDPEAIRAVLGERDYGPALRPGRRDAAAEELRAELVAKVGQLREAGAHQEAIAAHLGCSPRAVRNLIRAWKDSK